MHRFRSLVSIVFITVLAACSGSGTLTTPNASHTSASTGSQAHTQDTLGGLPRLINAVVSVALGDGAPRLGGLSVSNINIAVSEVDVISNGVVTPVAKFETPAIVDVFAYQDNPGSVSTADANIGAYDHVQFVIDTTRSAVVDTSGASHPINFEVAATSQSSAQAAAATVTAQIDATHVAMSAPGPFSVNGNPATQLQADFNAFESLMLDSNGNVIARPALFSAATALCGKIAGSIVNKNGQPVKNATIAIVDAGGTVVNTSNSDDRGEIKMHTIPAGTYRVMLYNVYTTAVGQRITAANASSTVGTTYYGQVQVVSDQTSDLGQIQD